MVSFWESISKLPEGPLAIILEKLADSYAVYLEDLTLHVKCVDQCQEGGPGDLLYVMLACHWGLVKSVKFCTYKLWEVTIAPELRIKGVQFLEERRFLEYLELVNNRVEVSFEDCERPILEAWKSGDKFEETWKTFFEAAAAAMSGK